jgi:hypothetical protein
MYNYFNDAQLTEMVYPYKTSDGKPEVKISLGGQSIDARTGM